MDRVYHVAKTGNDRYEGSKEKPFATISAAACIACPGDTVIVHEGEYREWVIPEIRGDSDVRRIVYEAAAGEHVVIKGSEVISNWECEKGSVWKVTIPDSFFGSYNPYREVIWGDWFNSEKRVHHTGEVYLNGRSLYEVENLEKVENPEPWPRSLNPEESVYTWYCENNDDSTTIWANFHGLDPNKELVEINVRPACFYPVKTGINYITVRGFRMCHAATNWAPPTAEQTGLIGPHWSKGWIIEDNIIHDSKCSGISLGKERSTGHNEWTSQRRKLGTQNERDVVFRALRIGWSKDKIGSHIVRNNTIYNCEQTGICGHLGAVFSEIYNNHIYNIHVKDQFSGAEVAGIKLHAPIDTLLKNNHIHHCLRGMWMDWQAQGTRITGNLLYSNRGDDIFVEVSHGPYLVDNNILLSSLCIRNWSQGGAYVHNLIGGKILRSSIRARFTHYHFPHETGVAGLMLTLGGDDRFFNNIFAPMVQMPDKEKPDAVLDDGDAPDSRKAKALARSYLGLCGYDNLPCITEPFDPPGKVADYAEIFLPVHIGSNLYLGESKPYIKEKKHMVKPDFDPQVQLEVKGNDVILHFTVDESFEKVDCPEINTELLGKAFQSEMPFEHPDGSPLTVDTDYFDGKRSGKTCVGPFAALKKGRFSVKIGTLTKQGGF